MDLEKFDLDDFEPIFMKGLVSDQSIFASVSPYLKKPNNYFTNKDFIEVIKFYKFFFDKREKFPTKDELYLFLKEEEMRKSVERTFNLIEKIDFESMDRDLFLHTSERYLKERAILNTILKIASDMETSAISASECLAKFEKICGISFDRDGGLDLYENLDRVINSLTSKRKTLSTGFSGIDKKIDGGLYADGRALYMFMGPPKKGKSLFLGNIACNVANQGKTVLLLSLEMSEDAYAARFCSQLTAIPFGELHLRSDEVRERMENKKGKIIIKEFPPSSITVSQIKAWIKKNMVERGIKPDLIVIDYLNLITGPGDGMYERIKLITEGVRALSYYFQCSIVSATQANRQANGREPSGLNAVSESSGISMTADVLWEILQNDEDKTLNQFRINFTANRYGGTGYTVPLKVDYQTLRITEIAEEVENSDMNEEEEDYLAQFTKKGDN